MTRSLAGCPGSKTCALKWQRLLQAQRPALDAKERAVAIRSLLVSTARESVSAALDKALSDIDRYRRNTGARA